MFGRIILGWWYYITNKNNELARRRLAHCVPCEFRKGLLCNKCGCVLQAKARLIEETCPDNRWAKIFEVTSMSQTKKEIDEALRDI